MVVNAPDSAMIRLRRRKGGEGEKERKGGRGEGKEEHERRVGVCCRRLECGKQQEWALLKSLYARLNGDKSFKFSMRK